MTKVAKFTKRTRKITMVAEFTYTQAFFNKVTRPNYYDISLVPK